MRSKKVSDFIIQSYLLPSASITIQDICESAQKTSYEMGNHFINNCVVTRFLRVTITNY